MLNSVLNKIELDAAHVLEELIGVDLEPRDYHAPILQNAYWDVGTGEGDLLTKVLEAFKDGKQNPYTLSKYVADLVDPFCWSRALFENPWRRNYEFNMECLRRDLPFVYNDDRTKHWPKELSTYFLKDLILKEVSSGPIPQIIEAYKYGNGFPVLRTFVVPDHYNRAVNTVLRAWVAIFKED